jgi:hypothetical protein
MLSMHSSLIKSYALLMIKNIISLENYKLYHVSYHFLNIKLVNVRVQPYNSVLLVPLSVNKYVMTEYLLPTGAHQFQETSVVSFDHVSFDLL